MEKGRSSAKRLGALPRDNRGAFGFSLLDVVGLKMFLPQFRRIQGFTAVGGEAAADFTQHWRIDTGPRDNDLPLRQRG